MHPSIQEFLFGLEPIRWVQQTLGLGWPFPFRVVSHLGATWGVIFVLGLALWLWGRDVMYAIAGIVVVEAAASVLFNQIWNTPRPSGPGIVRYEHLSIGSFPSGHTFAATMLWGGLYALRRIPLWIAALVVALVGLARLYLGVHYVSDIVGGLALAVVLVWGFAHLWVPVCRWLGRRSFGFFAVFALLVLAGVAVAAFRFLGSNPFMWNAAGIAAGAAVALPLEARFVRYLPAPTSHIHPALIVCFGLGGIIPLLLVDRLTGEEAFLLGAAATMAATLWALLILPAVLASSRFTSGPAEG